MVIDDFNRTIDIWIEDLKQYDFTRLCAKPSPDSWSLGQMYNHLIADTKFYIQQMKICLSNNDHAAEEASVNAKIMFLNNDFPDVSLEGSPDNINIPQPDNKQELINDLINLKEEMNDVAALLSKSPFVGKTKHPGLNYFNASEWLQFADMHFRHHARQKKRIENFLNFPGSD